MKKIIFILLLLLNFGFAFSQEDSESMFIYRNDGEFNAFFITEVDSITHSNMDIDGNILSEVAVKEVWTKDSLYRIPVAAIDSVSFKTPPVKYQNDVVCITENWRPYIISATSNTLVLSSGIPSELMPAKGDVLFLPYYFEPFENGFAGRVSKIENSEGNITVTCQDVEAEDIFQQLIAHGEINSTGEGNTRASTNISWIPEVTIPLLNTYFLNGNMYVKPDYTLEYTVQITGENRYMDIKLIHDYNCQLEYNITTNNIDLSPDLDLAFSVTEAIPEVPGLFIRLGIGCFLDITAQVDARVGQPFHVHGVTGFKASDEGNEYYNDWNATYEDITQEVKMNGNLTIGFGGKCGIFFISPGIASVNFQSLTGPEFEANMTLDSFLELSLDYNDLKDASLKRNHFTRVGFEGNIFGLTGSLPFVDSHILQNEWFLVPEFDNLKWTPVPKKESGYFSGAGYLTGEVRRNLLFEVSLGWELWTVQDYENMYDWDYLGEYRLESEWNFNDFRKEYEDLPVGRTYKAYPLIKFGSREIQVPQYVTFEIDPEVITEGAEGITAHSAVVSGRVNGFDNDNFQDVEMGVCYSKGNPYEGTFIKSDINYLFLHIELDGLEPSTTYNYAVYAKANGRYYFGEAKSFTTEDEKIIIPETVELYSELIDYDYVILYDETFKYRSDVYLRADFELHGLDEYRFYQENKDKLFISTFDDLKRELIIHPIEKTSEGKYIIRDVYFDARFVWENMNPLCPGYDGRQAFNIKIGEFGWVLEDGSSPFDVFGEDWESRNAAERKFKEEELWFYCTPSITFIDVANKSQGDEITFELTASITGVWHFLQWNDDSQKADAIISQLEILGYYDGKSIRKIRDGVFKFMRSGFNFDEEEQRIGYSENTYLQRIIGKEAIFAGISLTPYPVITMVFERVRGEGYKSEWSMISHSVETCEEDYSLYAPSSWFE